MIFYSPSLTRLFFSAAIGFFAMLTEAEAGKLETVITAVAAGASAVGFHEHSEQEKLREAYKAQGLDPAISAVFDVEITLYPNADSVFWADTLGSSDLFLVLEGSGNSSIAPFRHDDFKGGTIHHMLQGNAIQPGHGFALHLYDDDNVLNDVFSALMPKRITPSMGILTPVGRVNGSLELELQGGHVEIKKPDYIGAIAFTAPKDNDWKVSGDIHDQYGLSLIHI